MRRAFPALLPLCTISCSVPNVDFYDAATHGAPDARADARDEAGPAPNDAASDSRPNGPADAAVDVYYCGDSGITPPNSTCCPNSGPVCIGKPCTKANCASCAGCNWPQVCCVSKGPGVCEDVTLCP
jgi:hypothetical protein